METKIISSPFFETGVFGHNPFEYKGEVYRFNPTIVNVEQVLKLLNSGDKSILKGRRRRFFGFPMDKPVIVGIIDKVFDDPFLGGVEAKVPEAEAEAKEINEMLVNMNGIEFHRQMYQFSEKEIFEKVVKYATKGKTPDEMEVHHFLYMFCMNFFAKYLVGGYKMDPKNLKKLAFFKKVYEDMNAFDYAFLGHMLPEDRTHMHLLVWEM